MSLWKQILAAGLLSYAIAAMALGPSSVVLTNWNLIARTTQQVGSRFGFTSITRPFANADDWTFEYRPDNTYPTKAISKDGRSFLLETDQRGRITRITAPDGSTIDYSYGAVGSLNAIAVEDVQGNGKTARTLYRVNNDGTIERAALQ